MGFDGYFNLVSYLTLIMGFATLVLTGEVGPITIMIGAVALTTSWLADNGKLKLRLPPGWGYLAILVVPFFFADWQFLSGSAISALIRLILFLSIFKLFTVKQDRDWLFLYSLSMFEMLLAAALSVSVLYMILLVVYVLALLLTLTASEIRRAKSGIEPVGEIEILSTKTHHKSDSPIVRHLFRVSLVLLVLSLLLATPLFIFMPRPYSGWLGQMGGTPQNLSGFSDTVQLGDVASLKKNPQVVMHVKVYGAEHRILSRLKWRGIALDHYDGEKWQNTFVSRIFVKPQGDYFAVDNGPPQSQAEPVKQTFFIEPLSNPVIFAAWRPYVVRGNLRRVMRDYTSSLYSDDHSTSRISYTVDSDSTIIPPDLLRGARTVYPSTIRTTYLQMPTIDPRVKQLAIQITRGATNNYDRAKMIETYLRTQFEYSLEVPRTNEADALVDFLFNTKRGYCQYFATAMAVMLRSLGIPARIVNGFQTGDYNPMTGSFVVRQSDAHSWVEAYFPLIGNESSQWAEFDPTPAAGQSIYEGGFMTALARLADAIDFMWQQNVISYDSQQQVKIWDRLEKQLTFMKSNVMALFKQSGSLLGPNGLASWSLSTWIVIGIGLVVLITMLVLLKKAGWLQGLGVWRWKWFAFFRGKATYRESAFSYYDEMQQILAKRDIVRLPGQTPLELALTTDFPEVLHITRSYNRIRFSTADIGPDDLKEISHWLVRLRQRLANLDRGPRRKRNLDKS